MIRAVFDTVVFVRALLNRRSRWARLVFEHTEDYRLIVSPPVVREVVGVVRRPELVRRFTTLPGRNRAAVATLLAEAARVDIDTRTMPRVCRDPKDDMFLATAKAGGAAYIVSEDDDLLVLGEYERIRIADTETFLGIIERHDDANRGRGA